MTPAWEGVRAATGEFVCFLSDDNAYLPGHLAPLVAALDADPEPRLRLQLLPLRGPQGAA